MRLFGCGLTIAAVAFGFIHLGLARRAGFGRGFSLCHGRIERQIGLHRRFGRARGLGGFHRGLCHRLRRGLWRGGGDDWHDNGGCDLRDDGRRVCALLTPLCPARLVITAGLIFATGLVVTTLLVVPARLILSAGLVALAAVTLRAVVVPVLAIAAVRIVVPVLIVAAILVITTVLVIATVLVIVARLVAIATVIPLTIAIAVIAARLLLRAGLWRFNQIVVLTASIDHLNRAGIILHPIPAPFAAIVAVIAPGFAVAIAIPVPVTVAVLVAVLATILVRLALLAALTLFLLGGHLTHRLTQEAGVMLGVLHEILSGNTVIRELGIPCEELILLDDLLWRAAHFPLRARAVEHAVDDVAE